MKLLFFLTPLFFGKSFDLAVAVISSSTAYLFLFAFISLYLFIVI